MSDLSYVRSEMLEQRDPPASTTGVIGWIRENLFAGWMNSILTVLSLAFLYYVLSNFLPWFWSPVIRDRWVQMLFGFYPSELYWRPILAFVLLFVALIPVLFSMISRRANWFALAAVLFIATIFAPASAVIWVLRLVMAAATLWLGYMLMATGGEDRAEQIKQGAKRLPNPLLFSGLYLFVMPWLLWGGSFWTPVGAALGFVIGWVVLRYLTPVLGTIATTILAVVAAVLWWLFATGLFSAGMHAILPFGLEEVVSRKFGGLMLSITIGVTAIVMSLPLGIMLALGRQSDLLIVKWMSVGFIEFIRGVPLITLLFVASLLLNIFLPPGTDFDIILRVIIMATLFSAAYIAEVVRGGLAALPRGQYEAADALGLDYWKAQRLIIMPQALKISIPGIVSTFIGLFKDTTLVSVIGLLDPVGLSNAIRANAEWNGVVWELYGFIAFLFFIFTFSMARYAMYLERRLRTDHR
ncbi:MAG: ABC transporter permease subunit [Maritimibacter sp.]